MTRQGLRVFLQDWFCGCGNPDEAAAELLRLLELCPLYDHRTEFEALFPSSGMGYLVLYTLDHFDLIEHGGNVGGSWLTEKGQQVRDALRRESASEFDALAESSCVHGYGVDTELLDCPECGPMNR